MALMGHGSFDMYVVFSDKKLIALHHGEWILFGDLYRTHTFINNLNDGEMITSHLMFELHYKTTFLW